MPERAGTWSDYHRITTAIARLERTRLDGLERDTVARIRDELDELAEGVRRRLRDRGRDKQAQLEEVARR